MVEPRLLLSASLAAPGAALAVVESLHDNLTAFHSVLEATERFDVFGKTAPLVQNSGSGEASIGQVADFAKIFYGAVVTPFEQMLEDLSPASPGGPLPSGGPQDTEELATTLNELMDKAFGTTNQIYVTDNSSGSQIDLDFEFLNKTRNLEFSVTLGDGAEEYGFSFPNSLKGSVEINDFDMGFSVRITDFSGADLAATKADALNSFSLLDAHFNEDFDVEATVPSLDFNLGLLALKVDSGGTITYGGAIDATFANSITHTQLVDAAGGDDAHINPLVDITSTVAGSANLNLGVSLAPSNATILNLGAITGSIAVTGSAEGDNWTTAVTGLDLIKSFGNLSVDDAAGLIENFGSFLGRLDHGSLLDQTIPFTDGTAIGNVFDIGAAFGSDVADQLGQIGDILGLPDVGYIAASAKTATAVLTLTPIPLNAEDLAVLPDKLPAIFHIDVGVNGKVYDLTIENPNDVTTVAALAVLINTAKNAASINDSVMTVTVVSVTPVPLGPSVDTIQFTVLGSTNGDDPPNLSLSTPNTTFKDIAEFQTNLAKALGISVPTGFLTYNAGALGFNLDYHVDKTLADLAFSAGANLGDIGSLEGSGDLSIVAGIDLNADISFNLDDGDPILASDTITDLPFWPTGPVTADQIAGGNGHQDMTVTLRDGSLGTIEFQTGTFVVNVTDGNGATHNTTVTGGTIDDLLKALNFVGGDTNGANSNVTATFNEVTQSIEIRDKSVAVVDPDDFTIKGFAIHATNDSLVAGLLGIAGPDRNGPDDSEGLIVGARFVTTADRLVFNDLSITGKLDLTIDNLTVAGSIGVIGFEAAGDGGVSIAVSLALEPGTTLHDIDSAESLGTLGDIFDVGLTAGTPGNPWASLNLDVTELNINGVISDPVASISIVFDAVVGSTTQIDFEAAPTITLVGLDDVSALRDFAIKELLNALIWVVDELSSNDQALDLELWGLGVAFNGILDWAGPLHDSLVLLRDGGVDASLSELSDSLTRALGTPVTIAINDDILTLALTYAPAAVADEFAFDLNIGSLADEAGISIPDAFRDLASSSGVIAVTAAATLALSLGVRLNEGLADDERYFINTGATGLTLSLTAEGSDINFNTQFGPLSAGVEGGTFKLGAGALDGSDPIAAGEAGFEITGPATITFGLMDGAQAGRATFTEIDDAGSDIFEIVDNMAIDIDLPISFLGASDLASITVQVGNVLAGPDDSTVFVELPNFDEFDVLTFLNNPQAVINGLDAIFAVADSYFGDDVFGFKLPLIGDALDVVDDFITDLRSAVIGYLQGLLDDFISAHPDEAPTTAGIVAAGLDEILDIIGYDQHAVTNEVSPDDNGGQIEFHLTAREVLFEGSVDMTSDFGIPGLGMNIQNGEVNLEIFTALDLTFGYNMEEGFYFVKSEGGSPAIELGFNATLANDFSAALELGIVAMTATDVKDNAFETASGGSINGTTLSGGFFALLDSDDDHIAFADVGDAFKLELGADATVDLHLTARIDNGLPIELPSVSAELLFQYRYETILVGDGDVHTGVVIPVTFMDVTLDAGEFLESFLMPILEYADIVLDPLDPVLDFLTDPLPGVSELIGKPTSVIDIVDLVGGSDPEIKLVVVVVRMLDQIKDLIDSIKDMGSDEILLAIGDFKFGDASTDPDLVAQGAALTGSLGIDSFAQAAQDFDINDPKASLKTARLLEDDLSDLPVIGPAVSGAVGDALDKIEALQQFSSLNEGKFSVPILEDPLAALQLLTGNVVGGVDLVAFEFPDIHFAHDFNLHFPLAGIPLIDIGVDLGMAIALDLQFRMAYDTGGIVEFMKTDNALFLLDGFYIDSSRGPQIEAEITITVGASLNTPLAKAGVAGAITGDFSLELHDPNHDGKLRALEIVSLLTENPINLFEFDGKITARIYLWVWVGIDIGIKITLFELEKDLLPDSPVTLVEFHYEAPDSAILGTQNGGTVTLNMGALSDQRIDGSGELGGDEVYTITGTGDNITVEFGGVTQDFTGVDLITADFGDGNAQIVVVGKVNAEIVLTGGDGSSRIDLSQAYDPIITLGDGDNIVLLAQGPNLVTAGNGNNTIIGSTGKDTINLGDGNNYIEGGDNDDEINVGKGHNTIIGGRGNDIIITKSGNNVIFGGVASTNTTTTIAAIGDAGDGDNTITVSSGKNVIIGGWGNDTIDASSGGNVVLGDVGTVTLAPTETVNVSGLTATIGGTLTLGDTVTLWFDNANFPTYTVNGGDAYTASVSHTVKAGDTTEKIAADLALQINSNATYQGIMSATATGAGVTLVGVDTLVAEAKTTAFNTVLVTGVGAIGGNDNIKTGAGNDIIVAGAGDDIIDAGHGLNLVLGDTGLVDGTSGGNAGNFTIVGDLDGTGKDTVTTGSGVDVVMGDLSDDIIKTGSGADFVSGDNATVIRTKAFGPDALLVSATAVPHTGSGIDSIDAGTGNDIIFGGGQGDSIDGGTGDNVIFGDFGYVIPADGTTPDVVGTDTGDATTGTDTITVSDGNNIIMGGGNVVTDDGDFDLINVTGKGASLVFGDTGHVIRAPGTLLRLVAETIEENIGGKDQINVSGDDNNTVLGGTDKDTITLSGTGNNVLLGDLGIITVAAATSITTGAPHPLDYPDGVDYPADGVVGDLTSGPTINAVGVTADIVARNTNIGDDDVIALTGTADGNNIAMGSAGNDTITTDGGGINILFGDTGEVTRAAGTEIPLLAITSEITLGGTDTITATTGTNYMLGGEFRDFLNGGDGDDHIIGDIGHFVFYPTGIHQEMRSTNFDIGNGDVITTGAGNNYVVGGTGADTITGGVARDTLIGDQGLFDWNPNGIRKFATTIDEVPFKVTNDTILGGDGIDNLFGGKGGDIVDGEAGSDIVMGDDGHIYFRDDLEFIAETINPFYGAPDIIIGGPGNDYVFGGGPVNNADALNNTFYADPLQDMIFLTVGHAELNPSRIGKFELPPFLANPIMAATGNWFRYLDIENTNWLQLPAYTVRWSWLDMPTFDFSAAEFQGSMVGGMNSFVTSHPLLPNSGQVGGDLNFLFVKDGVAAIMGLNGAGAADLLDGLMPNSGASPDSPNDALTLGSLPAAGLPQSADGNIQRLFGADFGGQDAIELPSQRASRLLHDGSDEQIALDAEAAMQERAFVFDGVNGLWAGFEPQSSGPRLVHSASTPRLDYSTLQRVA